jgi:hypothetical protein
MKQKKLLTVKSKHSKNETKTTHYKKIIKTTQKITQNTQTSQPTNQLIDRKTKKKGAQKADVPKKWKKPKCAQELPRARIRPQKIGFQGSPHCQELTSFF